MKCNCLCGCEVSLSLCLCLQMHSFERIGSRTLPRCNWCWNQHGYKSLQSAARTEFGGSVFLYRYVCTLWRPWTYILFYNSAVWCSYSRFFTDHKCPPPDHILSLYNSAHIFITFSLILYSMACCSQTHPIIIIIIIIIIIHIFKDLNCDPFCFPQSVYYIFYWPSNINFPMQNLSHNNLLWCYFIIFSIFPLFWYVEVCL
jgi:hypothetical protein